MLFTPLVMYIIKVQEMDYVQQFMECQWTWNYDWSHFLIEEMADDVCDEDDGDCY